MSQLALKWVNLAHNEVNFAFKAYAVKRQALIDLTTAAPATPPGEPVKLEAPQPALQKILGILRSQSTSQATLLQKTDARMEQNETMLQKVLNKAVSCEQRLEQTNEELNDQRDSIAKLQAQRETNSDEIIGLKEEVFALKKQLATGESSSGNHVHLHQHRVIIVINNTQLDLQAIPEPVALWWYNRHNEGHKYTRVWLPPQEPRTENGQVMVDLLESKWETTPSIQGIYPCHLSLVDKASKRPRRR